MRFPSNRKAEPMPDTHADVSALRPAGKPKAMKIIGRASISHYYPYLSQVAVLYSYISVAGEYGVFVMAVFV